MDAEKILTTLVELWCDQHGLAPENITITKNTDTEEETA